MIAFNWSLVGGLLGGAIGALVGMITGSLPRHHATSPELLQSALMGLFFGLVPSALNAYLSARMSPKAPSGRHRAILLFAGALLIGLPMFFLSALVASFMACI